MAQARRGCSRPARSLQQVAQASGLLALLVIVTLLARAPEVAELGAYGLVASLAGYLLVLRNSVASAAVRAMAGRGRGRGARERVRGRPAAVRARGAWPPGLLIAGVAVLIAGIVLDGTLAHDARAGGIGLGVVTAVGIAASIQLDRLRARADASRARPARRSRPWRSTSS